MVNLANCCLLLLPCRITRLRRATYINPKFAKHKHVPQTHLGGTSRCFARQNCRAEHVNVPPGPLWRGWRCFAIIGLRIGVVSSGGPCAAVWRNGAGGGRAQNKKRSLAKWLNSVSAVRTRLELATPGVTGRYSKPTELPHQLSVNFPFGIAKVQLKFDSANILKDFNEKNVRPRRVGHFQRIWGRGRSLEREIYRTSAGRFTGPRSADGPFRVPPS